MCLHLNARGPRADAHLHHGACVTWSSANCKERRKAEAPSRVPERAWAYTAGDASDQHEPHAHTRQPACAAVDAREATVGKETHLATGRQSAEEGSLPHCRRCFCVRL